MQVSKYLEHTPLLLPVNVSTLKVILKYFSFNGDEDMEQALGSNGGKCSRSISTGGSQDGKASNKPRILRFVYEEIKV